MRMLKDLQSQAKRNGAPATYAMIALCLIMFVVTWFMPRTVGNHFAFVTDFSQPWGLLTYPFAVGGNGTAFFWFVLTLFWFFWVGTSTERDLGTAKFLGFFFGSSILAGIFLALGAGLHRFSAYEAGLNLPLAALTVLWGCRHMTEQIHLWMVIPIAGKWLAILTVFMTLFGYGTMYASPLMGVFACLHLGLAYLVATNRVPFFLYSRPVYKSKVSKATETRDKSYYDDVKRREQQRDERERLRKLFEGSLKDDAGNDR